MKRDDAYLSANVIQASELNESIPLSELIRKEAFNRFFSSFTEAIRADPAMIKAEIQRKMKYYDMLYGRKDKTEKEKKV